MNPLTATHTATGTHRGWPVAYLGPGCWAALDSTGRVLMSGSHDAVMHAIDNERNRDSE